MKSPQPKIVIIGGGSYTWGPLFLRDLMATPELLGSTIMLHDSDPQPLELVYTLGRKIIRECGLSFEVQKTTSLAESLEGANFVVLTITTGGLEAMRHDLEIPARYGIYQSVGDTVGPGGLARALRNIPVVVDIARKMEQICPQAWLLNYTNPMTTLCRAVTRQTRIKTIGLCHEFLGVRRKLANLFGVTEADIQAGVGGINHLTWILELTVSDRDAFPELRTFSERILAGELVVDDDPTSLIDRARVKARLFQIFGALPAAGDRHVAEFFPFFLSEAAGRGREYGIELTHVEERYQWRELAHAYLQSLLDGQFALPPFLQKTSGEAANEIIAAISGDGQYTGVMNLPNIGQISNLPDDVVVETFGVVDSSGARPVEVGALPPGVHNVVSRHVNNQEMIVSAALNGDRVLALQALLNDPLVHDLDQAEKMLEEMLAANRQYLPLF